MYNWDKSKADSLLQWFKDNISEIAEYCFARGLAKDKKDWAQYVWYINLLGEDDFDEIFSISDIKSAMSSHLDEVCPSSQNGGSTTQLPFGFVQWHQQKMQFHHSLEKLSEFVKKICSMGAYQHMKGLYPDLVAKAKTYGYPESSICILGGDESRLKSEFPNTFSNLNSCKHNRDSRTAMEYGQDLVASWLFEDFLMESLTKVGIEIEGVGADKNREVLPTTKVSASSDCVVSYGGKKKLLELMSDYTGYWSRYCKMELRDSKFKKMQESNSLFLGVSTVDNKYILLDMGGEFESKYIPSYFLYGGKPAHSIKLPKQAMKQLDFQVLASDIINIL